MSNDSNRLFNNRYLTIKELGGGGFSRTYLAVDTHLPSRPKCVVKQLTFETDDPEIYELVQTRFQREAAILEVLGKLSPQIPNLYASSQEGNNLYLVQDWIDGEDLQDTLDKKGPRSEKEVTEILAQLLPVLAIVHAKNIIHRDIKPANIMVRNQDGKAFLIDFGAVKEVIPVADGFYGDTSRSVFIGTPPFAPSEQHQGRPVFASDLYSLGLTAICLLTGKQPSWKETDLQTGKPVIHRFRPGNWHSYATKVSSKLKAALDKAIQPSAEERYQTAREMQSALRLTRSVGKVTTTISLATGMDRLVALAEKYNDIREAYKEHDTSQRRELMMGVFNEIVELTLQEESLNVLPYLDSDNWGKRLAAYVHVYTYPRVGVLSEMISSVAKAGRQPFVQHRGIEAIGKILERYHGSPEALKGIKKLRGLLGNLEANTMRHAELRTILNRYDVASAAINEGENRT
jgi:serine/threonine protein kinase